MWITAFAELTQFSSSAIVILLLSFSSYSQRKNAYSINFEKRFYTVSRSSVFFLEGISNAKTSTLKYVAGIIFETGISQYIFSQIIFIFEFKGELKRTIHVTEIGIQNQGCVPRPTWRVDVSRNEAQMRLFLLKHMDFSTYFLSYRLNFGAGNESATYDKSHLNEWVSHLKLNKFKRSFHLQLLRSLCKNTKFKILGLFLAEND